MKNVCPECGYNAGENGEKVLQLHMSIQHGPNSQRRLTPEQLAVASRENEITIARMVLVLGVVPVLLGLGLAAYGYGTYATLTCRSFTSCFISNSLLDQIRTSGLAAVYIGSQQTVYGGLLLFVMGSMGVSYWPAKRLPSCSENTAGSSGRDLPPNTGDRTGDCWRNNSLWTTHYPSDLIAPQSPALSFT